MIMTCQIQYWHKFENEIILIFLSSFERQSFEFALRCLLEIIKWKLSSNILWGKIFDKNILLQ